MWKTLASGLLVLGWAGVAQAQTAYGPGGLLVHPSAFMPPRASVSLYASHFTQTEPGGASREWQPTSLTYSPTGQTQLGATLLRRPGQGDTGGIFLKHLLVAPVQKQAASVSFVGSYLGPGVKQTTLGLVASQRVMVTGQARYTGHVGLQWAGDSRSDSLAAFVGAEAALGPNLSVLAEVGSRLRFNIKESSSIGLVWNGRGQTVRVGYVNTGASETSRFFIGAGYPLGGVK